MVQSELSLSSLRPDRDEHVTVLFENIREGYEHNFNIRNDKFAVVEELVTPYDIFRKDEDCIIALSL